MASDILKIYEEYSEQILFCKYFIAEYLNHNAEMGRCGENILIKELRERFGMLEFISGFIVCDGERSNQCDILVCRKNMYKRCLGGDLYLVDPADCLMVIEVKGNLTLRDINETSRKNQFFTRFSETKHIQLALFAYKTRVAKKTLYSEFGYRYERISKSYSQNREGVNIQIDLFVCLHRETLNSTASRDKQLLFIKDRQEVTKFHLSREFPVFRIFLTYIYSLQEQ
ncbi:hypothetical protein QVE09_17840 [Paenibacillus sp. ClWae2A]|uniref:DUF6602 domain-containing protein n=2 Tax=unclassified Paenibacillus TaxID=185978 RepID=UPI0028F60DF0|nr:DUF6602 domain-containing protein [Paenibacillus sp. ClWae2A]MDT9720783.1 hypothetical protein [Paenibacillus sp. ClWae2A]